MTPTVSTIIPVKNGARWLAQTLGELAAQRDDAMEVLVIDSGSRDDSVAIARAAGARVLEIAPREFRHGRTRNLAAALSEGELICFLSQDAIPCPGWVRAYREAMSLGPDVGAAFGPQLPRPGAAPFIARELHTFFGAFDRQGGRPRVLGIGDPPFLSNVNACYRRDCWNELRFPDVPYAEDRAFAQLLRGSGWHVAYHPAAAVVHSHDYGPLTFMRRHFDEFAALHAVEGFVEPFGVRSKWRDVQRQVSGDRAWMRAHGPHGAAFAIWSARSLIHHAGRKAAMMAATHPEHVPAPVRRAISLEATAHVTSSDSLDVAPGGSSPWEVVSALAREDVAPLLEPVPGLADAQRLHIAVLIPPFSRGSGGHSTIYQLVRRLEERGHVVTTWLHDGEGLMVSKWPAVVRAELREYFGGARGPVFKRFEQEWFGADVALATGWDTVYRVMTLDHCRARAYLVQDDEPQFFATSAQALWAEGSYTAGAEPIAVSPWLAALVAERSGTTPSVVDLGVDHEIYRVQPIRRRTDTVIFYAREFTPRRAVPLGILALAELHRRRPDIRLVLFGDHSPPNAPFPYEHLGVVAAHELAARYAQATVGLCLSLTNHSLVPHEMLACGLPCVEIAGRSWESVHGPDSPPLRLVAPDPLAIADALEELLDDPEQRARRAEAGIAAVAARTWEAAGQQLEAALRDVLRRRELDAPPVAPPAPIVSREPPVASVDLRTVKIDPVASSEVTDVLFARLSAADVARLAATIDAGCRRDEAPDVERRRAILAAAAAGNDRSALKATGLSSASPPDDVHAMARGPQAAGGSAYYADLVAGALRAAGRPLETVTTGLDFGCSSGRVVRVLQAARPQVDWHGCDPNAAAVRWAAQHLPGVDFAHSPSDPPIGYDDATFDLVYAISIWSHFASAAAQRWLSEMARIMTPGGVFVLTAHGPQSLTWWAQRGGRSARQRAEIRRALHRAGFWYGPEFGDRGDWGVLHPHWGTAFFTAEWLLRHVRGSWSVMGVWIGQAEGNQDVYALVRR